MTEQPRFRDDTFDYFIRRRPQEIEEKYNFNLGGILYTLGSGIILGGGIALISAGMGSSTNLQGIGFGIIGLSGAYGLARLRINETKRRRELSWLEEEFASHYRGGIEYSELPTEERERMNQPSRYWANRGNQKS